MSQEDGSRTNPLRFCAQCQTASIASVEKQRRVFDNQVPGKYVIDATGNTFVCTNFKTINGTTVWDILYLDSSNNWQPQGIYHILVNAGDKMDKTKKAYTVNSSGQKIYYESAAIAKRLFGSKGVEKVGAEKLKTFIKSNYFYLFIAVSENDYRYIKGEPLSSILTPIYNSTRYFEESTDIELAVETTFSSVRGFEEANEYMRVHTNGRSGVGGLPGNINPKNQYDKSTQKQYTSVREFEDANPPSPSPSGSSNPSSSAPSATTSTGKNPAKGSPAADAVNSPKFTSVKVNFLPDVIIDSGAAIASKKPYIEQTTLSYENNNRQKVVRRHVFDIIPNTFQLSELSSAWNEVERSGNYAYVDWSKYNLTKCTFSFLVAGVRADKADNVLSLVNDGMDVSVDEQINNIRIMASSPNPVRLYGLNTLLTNSFRYPYIDNARGIQWVINDMSINVTRQTPTNKIAAAEVSITLTEFPVVPREIVPLPLLRPDNSTKKKCKPSGTCPPPEKTYSLFTQTLEQGWYKAATANEVAYPPGK